MVQKIKSVALVGAGGNAGSAILKSLVKSANFDITVVARSAGKAGRTFPPGVAVKVVDFDSVGSLTAALLGNDAVIDVVGSPDPNLAIRLMDAAAAAGVYRYVPGEFSNDPRNAALRSLPVFQGKAVALAHLEKLAAVNKITYTAVSNGAFLDWGLGNGFLGIDLTGKKVELMNDGNHVFSWTQLPDVGMAVVNALLFPEQTKNRVCYIYSIQKSQMDVINLAKSVLGSDSWMAERMDMNSRYLTAMASAKAGDFSFNVMADLIKYSISTPGYAGQVEDDDNKLLGIEPMSDGQVKDMIKEIVKMKSGSK